MQCASFTELAQSARLHALNSTDTKIINMHHSSTLLLLLLAHRRECPLRWRVHSYCCRLLRSADKCLVQECTHPEGTEIMKMLSSLH